MQTGTKLVCYKRIYRFGQSLIVQYINSWIIVVETVAKCELAQNWSFTKRFTDFGQSLWNLVKMTSSWVGNIILILAWFDMNYGFYTEVQILGYFGFFFASDSILQIVLKNPFSYSVGFLSFLLGSILKDSFSNTSNYIINGSNDSLIYQHFKRTGI